MCSVKYRLFAYSNAAGKFNPQAPQQGNEDNYELSFDLGRGICKGTFDKDAEMPVCGVLMCVADGMGGMNAGEVASDIAVKTVAKCFEKGKILPETAKDPKKRRAYLEKVIVEADANIKEEAKRNPEHSGMGSTIILAWIVETSVTISWCGDSRAYRFNPQKGIELLSNDHSYVQELADKGVIRYEDTFDHPQNNIVTRSLGEPNKKALPESREFPIYENDIILLCSDGLSGVLRDKKTYYHDGGLIPGENLEDIMTAHNASLLDCKEALWAAAAKADWYDNVTTLLCKITSSDVKISDISITDPPKKNRFILPLIILLFLVVGVGTWYMTLKNKKVSESGKLSQIKTTIHKVADSFRKELNDEGKDALSKLLDMVDTAEVCTPHYFQELYRIKDVYKFKDDEKETELKEEKVKEEKQKKDGVKGTKSNNGFAVLIDTLKKEEHQNFYGGTETKRQTRRDIAEQLESLRKYAEDCKPKVNEKGKKEIDKQLKSLDEKILHRELLDKWKETINKIVREYSRDMPNPQLNSNQNSPFIQENAN